MTSKGVFIFSTICFIIGLLNILKYLIIGIGVVFTWLF